MNDTANDIMVAASGLAKIYGFGPKKVEAVRGIDLEIRRGEIFGLVGPDGAGKTKRCRKYCEGPMDDLPV